VSVEIPIGPKFKGLELELDSGATTGATVALDCRVVADGLRRMDPPNYLANVATAVRGLHCHTKADGTKVLLTATATELFAQVEATNYATPTAVNAAETGLAFTLTSSTSPVIFQQDGYYTYFVDTGNAKAPVYVYDERDNQVRSLVLPDAPTGVTVAVEELTSKIISPLSGVHDEDIYDPSGSAKVGEAKVDDGVVSSNFEVVGTWDSAHYSNSPWGPADINSKWHLLNASWAMPYATRIWETGYAKLNSGSSTKVGDGFYYNEGDAQDWTGTRITFDVWSGSGDDRTGAFMGFSFGTDAWDEHVVPFAITEAKTTVHITLDLSSYADSDALRNVKYWGFVCVDDTNDFVVSFRNLEKQEGTVGPRKYLFTDTLTVGTGDAEIDLASPEGPGTPVEADAGAIGSQVVLTGTVPSGHTRKVWRWDTDTASTYHYVGDWTGASYTDTTFDVSLNPTLQQGRVQAPVGAVAVGVHRGRLAVSTGNYVWLSRIGDPTTWLDMSPEVWVTLESAGLNTATKADGLKLPVADIGRVTAISQMGLATGADFRQDTILFGDAGMLAVLTGDEPPFAIAHKSTGGIAGPFALCSIPTGLAFVDPQGDVNTLDRALRLTKISTPLDAILHGLTNRSAWLLGYDPNTLTIALWADARQFAFDMQESVLSADPQRHRLTWTELGTAWDGATARTTVGAGEGAYLCFAGASGGIYRAMDPDHEPVPWTPRMAMALGTSVAPGNGYWYECTRVLTGVASNAEPVWPTTAWETVQDGNGGDWQYRGEYPDGWVYLTADYTRRNARLGMDNSPVRLRTEAENLVNCTVYADDVTCGTGAALWSYPVHCLPYGGARLSVMFEGDNNGALLSATLEAAIRRP
jgi:hypothetical protein